MYAKKKCIAMLLAGGQGSRLYALTDDTPKPAVGFGGKYRIIDFPLSNCINSGIDTVGVLTQYQPLSLNDYMGNGDPWDLNRGRGGLTILPPYQGKKKSDWYRGTANAIYQNMHFIEKYDPDYVLILSGDHIYQMDYADMLAYHQKRGADCTISTIRVPNSDASRYGICNTGADGRIWEFEEKPKKPKNDLASMGIYIFNTRVLRKYLLLDEDDKTSANDFGKNIIPSLLEAEERVFAYRYEGYWKDVGTVESLWEANMDLLNGRSGLDLSSAEFPIYSRNLARSPACLLEHAKVKNSLLADGVKIAGRVENSVLSCGVIVAEGAIVEDAVLLEDVVIEEGAVVRHAIINAGSRIRQKVIVGEEENSKIVLYSNPKKAKDIPVIYA